jgi:hypothetical protein
VSYTCTLFPSGAVQFLNTTANVPAGMVAMLMPQVIGTPNPGGSLFNLALTFPGPLGPSQSFLLTIQPSSFRLFNKGYRQFINGNSIDSILLSQTSGPLSIQIVLSSAFLTVLFQQIAIYISTNIAYAFSAPITIHYLTEVVNLGNIGQSNGSPTNPGNDG